MIYLVMLKVKKLVFLKRMFTFMQFKIPVTDRWESSISLRRSWSLDDPVELKTIPQSSTSAKRRQIKDIYKCVPKLDLNGVESCWENLCADRSICSKSDKRQQTSKAKEDMQVSCLAYNPCSLISLKERVPWETNRMVGW